MYQQNESMREIVPSQTKLKKENKKEHKNKLTHKRITITIQMQLKKKVIEVKVIEQILIHLTF
jgi:hypothetical protein